MDAVLKLCTRGIFFEKSRIQAAGDVETVVQAYLQRQSSSPRSLIYRAQSAQVDLVEKRVFCRSVRQSQRTVGQFPSGKAFAGYLNSC